MTDDLVKRLRDLSECAADVAPYVEVAPYESYKAMAQAADRIEELTAENARLKTALFLYRAAVRTDVRADGVAFSGSNVTALREAWEHDRRRLSQPTQEQSE